MPLLKKGSTGEDVKKLQQALINKGFFVGALDSDFGIKTETAVRYLQSTHGLDIDGEAGDQVHDLLDIGGAVSLAVFAEYPNIDVLPADQVDFPVAVTAGGGSFAQVDVRVVVWFRGPAGELHTEDTIQAVDTAATMARPPIPPEVHAHEGEVHWTANVYTMTGVPTADEGAGSFRVNAP
ncbi:MAG: hypothetical protein QOH68_3960 [Nocardioidaceae bacterium]|jgi:peptidoglycan hydrolase-like protein with peptidoglycan-binding domain|nr:hypothetical protein [Nocardioidaceae bacterium]